MWNLIFASNIAYLTADDTKAKVNTFNKDVLEGLEDCLERVAEGHPNFLIIQSKKKNCFFAGADIKEIQGISTPQEAIIKAEEGQRVFQKLADLKCTTVAIIDGICLGGGTEFALACDYRVVTDNPKTMIGLPEVNLGIIPGWGGTQRLPIIVGLMNSTMIFSGKSINPKKALKIGLADKIIPTCDYLDGIATFIADIAKGKLKKKKTGLSTKLLEGNPIGRKIFFRKAKKELMKKTGGNYPAPLAALEVIRKTFGKDLKKGLKIEANAFAELAATDICKNLVRLFFVNEGLKKKGGKADITDIKRTGVLGAGVMGGGIAWMLSRKGCPVLVKDLNDEALMGAYDTAKKYYSSLVKIRKMKPAEVDQGMLRISGTTNYDGFKNCDIVVEAIIENLDIKKKVFAELEENVSDDCIIVTNTSSLKVDDMAEALVRPERFCGMHFFNPVNRMPLVEVVPGSKTSQDTIDKVVAFVRKLGKFPIVVGDCNGFLVNRVLLAYLNRAMWLAHGGIDYKKIDKAMVDFGMPMGPFRLIDEIGIDVGYKVGHILQESYDHRSFDMCPLFEDINKLKLLGRKGNEGFYLYDKKKETINPKMKKLIKKVAKWEIVSPYAPPEKIAWSCLEAMNIEAKLCLEDGTVDSEEALDLAMIMGAGFPPFQRGILSSFEKLTNKLGMKGKK